MTKILFDIKPLEPITTQDKVIFSNQYINQELYDTEGEEVAAIYDICRYLERQKKCLFYSPFENDEFYYPGTALDFFVLDSYDEINKIISKENFSYNLELAETDENCRFNFSYNGDKVTVLKTELFEPDKFLYSVDYTYEEFYHMMKKIYNYLYGVAEVLLPTIYFVMVLNANFLRKLP
ncbi:hypothetical protein [Bartonella sp. HY761]|uniref:hypothetical protein n=1 Tax=Bartonella sp. HY761 TaxID=2979330 RepID=UPI00220097E9|nr:hypothetical protein [Bartonella sp. HY761]UXN05172.1 hypothetical protein N6A79_07500 [Bartonella sp. HY761]